MVSQMVIGERKMNQGQKLWKKAIEIIPGGNGLLSKRPDRYAPDIWPNYYSRAKGVEVWDLDGNKYVDMAQMGIGAAILGYCNDEVNETVCGAVEKGVCSTLNAPEEVCLAEKLLELNPFAGGVKFARTGGEAMAVAVRIARAFSGRDKVAFSGYHGWCDWYLAANLSGENSLGEHLLPGLAPEGVPKGLKGTALPFKYNDVEALEKLVSGNKDIGVIVIEGARYDFPKKEFLDAIEYIAKRNKIIVVSDEITSGWRMTDGGVYKLNGFKPDIVVYGKAMGNGFAISAVVGRKDVMSAAQDTFISSTFWTERVGFAAALKTIEILTREKIWEHLVRIGTKIGDGWEAKAKKHGVTLHITDFKPLISMKLDYGRQNSAIATLFTQEMLKRGYLAATSIYVSAAHTDGIIDAYMDKVDEVFGLISEAIKTGTVDDKLETKVRDEGFKRLN